MNELEAVELVDKLMITYRNGIRPKDEDVARAVELGIDVSQLKLYIEEYEIEDTNSEDHTEEQEEDY